MFKRIKVFKKFKVLNTYIADNMFIVFKVCCSILYSSLLYTFGMLCKTFTFLENDRDIRDLVTVFLPSVLASRSSVHVSQASEIVFVESVQVFLPSV